MNITRIISNKQMKNKTMYNKMNNKIVNIIKIQKVNKYRINQIIFQINNKT